jgi:hypothetical protein
MENWREYLNEENSEEIAQLSKIMGHSIEETIAQHIMIGEWKRAWNHFRGWYMEGKVDLELLVEALDGLLRDEYKRIRKNMVNTDWDKTIESLRKFIAGDQYDAAALARYQERFPLRMYEPQMRMPWQESPKDMLYTELGATILRNDIKIREKPDETPT